MRLPIVMFIVAEMFIVKNYLIKQRRFLFALLLALACSNVLLTELTAEPSFRYKDRLVGASIKSVMTRHGLPTRITKLDHNRAAYHWLFKASIFFSESESRRSEEFQCEVTAITSPRGTVMKLQAEVPNAGAGVLAAVGAFGRLCENSFGLKSRKRL